MTKPDHKIIRGLKQAIAHAKGTAAARVSIYVGVRLDPVMLKLIDAIAGKAGTTRSDVIRYLVERGIKSEHRARRALTEMKHG